jgi:hypothetical protein
VRARKLDRAIALRAMLEAFEWKIPAAPTAPLSQQFLDNLKAILPTRKRTEALQQAKGAFLLPCSQMNEWLNKADLRSPASREHLLLAPCPQHRERLLRD